MANWKYKVVQRRIKDVSELALNNLGNNGWELIFMNQLWNGKIIAVFKKQT
ncbi:MAG: hypothetical protein K9N07_07665 [Candidatus Cloacimonetes bacterium]|nr:hypothetical protein [Candidatus Cloacimonadota bacterium]MCF8012795.1 hypothetical protein [Candidatus Woesearchaeota archaeon]